jgi:hypothetical protein
MGYRKLTAGERQALEVQGCTAEDWGLLEAAQPFRPERVRGVRFSGPVRIGRLERSPPIAERSPPIAADGGPSAESGEPACGLYDSRVHDCTFGDGVLVRDVRLLSGYDLEEGVAVRDVGLLAAEGESGFGNGTRIDVLNETGGRTLTLCDLLSSQTAYLAVLHRHRPALAGALEKLIGLRVAALRSRRGRILRGSRVSRCGTLRNVLIGPYAEVEGALCLEDGSVIGCREDPSFVGPGVEARHFLILSGSRVEGGALLHGCFVGQGVRLGRQLSAEQTAFFANCEGDHGELASVLAGPYTVSHHKSTLLIAACLSFLNAGSATNQSNHMYKLGPLHQGILERGVKTGSGAYLVWPSRVGAFSTVAGKHDGSFDSSGLPFSYIGEEEGRSVLTPAVNLLNVGCRRDAEKWVARDRRRDPQKLDLITHGLFTPFTAGRMLRGLATLRSLAEKTPKERELVLHGGVYLRRLMLNSSARFYELALEVYLGDRLRARLLPLAPGGTSAELRRALSAGQAGAGEGVTGEGEWWDVGGLIAPAAEVERIETELEDGRIRSLEELNGRFRELADRCPELEWAWCRRLLTERLGGAPERAAPAQLAALLGSWKQAALRLNNLALADAAKEYDERARLGFGADGGPRERDEDFRAVRGALEGNPYVRHIREENAQVEKDAETLRAWLEGLRFPA